MKFESTFRALLLPSGSKPLGSIDMRIHYRTNTHTDAGLPPFHPPTPTADNSMKSRKTNLLEWCPSCDAVLRTVKNRTA